MLTVIQVQLDSRLCCKLLLCDIITILFVVLRCTSSLHTTANGLLLKEENEWITSRA